MHLKCDIPVSKFAFKWVNLYRYAVIKFAIMPAFEKLGYTKDMFLQW
jgi:hypothetical protein